MKLDNTDIEIIKHLQNGRKSFGKIAEELNVVHNTVRTRVTRMIDDGILEVTGLVSADAFPNHSGINFNFVI